METVNYTIKVQLLKSLSLDLTHALLRRFLHLSELALDAGADPKAYSEVEKAFEALCGRKLTSIDIESTKEVEAFHLTIRDKEQVKIYCLQNHILNHVEKNARTLRSNAQNHLSQFNSKQGITGTNWNFRCHYPHMEANQLASLGSDGQTIDHLFKSPSTPILLPELQHDAEKTIKLLFDQYLISGKKSPLHAWIDLGAYFKGITNKQIAFYLANFVSDLNKKKGLLHAFSHLQYILYFNEDNLYAMKIDGLPNNAAEVDSIILHGTKKDYIANRLNCSPDAYFTYYDQVHGTGTDIAQAKDAEALVTIGAKTLKRDKLQAVMRMRELKNLQKVIFVIPKELQDANPDFKASDWNVHTILKHCTDNEIARLADDHFRSAIMAMENILRSDLFGRILYSDRVGRQQALLIHFEDVFFTQVAKSAFEQFKHISKKETVSKVFAKVKEEITASFISLLQKSGINFVAADVKMLVENLEAIIRTAIPVCPLEVYQPNKNLTDSEIHIEKQQEVERQQELESEFDQQFRNNAVALPIKKWTYVNLLLWDLVPNTRIGGVGIYALESMRKTAEMNSPWQFSADILVTEHYLSTCEQQPNKLDTYKKEGLFILFIQDKMQKSLRSLILTPEEANYFKEKIVALRVDSHAPNRHIWIETVHQIELCGNKPSANLMDPRYMSHLEQIAFLNGDIDVLKHIFSAANTCWLKSEMMSKLQFLQKHILCVHKDKPRDLQFLYKLHSMPPQLPSLMVGHVQSIQLADMDAHVEALIQHINKAASFRKQLSALLEGPELSKPEIKSVILSYVFNDKAAAPLFSWKSLTASQNATFKIKY